jgi:GNAT superfamily N-acetyltransferase
MGGRGIEIRLCTEDPDERQSLAVYNAVWPRQAVTIEDVRSFKSSVRDHGDFLARLDGEAAGSALVAIVPQRAASALTLVTVLPEKRGRGVGTALYRLVSRWAQERGLGALQAPVEEDDAGSLAYAERRGFREIERNGRMVLELASLEPPAVTAPPGVEIATWAERSELGRGIYEVATEAYADVPGEDEEMEPFEDWLAHDMRGPGDRPEATFVAVAGDEVVGYAKLSFTEARPETALHDMTGVKRAWRGRGVARALKCAQIAWAKRAGFERLETTNEVRNEPIRRLNERLGYRPAPGRVLLEGPPAPS